MGESRIRLHPKLLIAVVVMAAAVGYLAYTSFQASAAYYVTLRELPHEGQLTGRTLRLGGQVEESSIRWEPETLTLSFDLVDGAQSVPVVYQGTVPDTFARTLHVLVEGELEPQGVFRAHSLFVQCPSKYEALVEGPAT